MRKTHLVLGCVVALIFGGCTGESNRPQATGEGRIRAINAIKTSPTMSILIEERQLGTTAYKRSTMVATYDDLKYTFNVEAILAGDVLATRIASQFIDVVLDTEYTLLISGALAAPDITVWETPVREFTGTETIFEARFAHTADSLGDIDVYFAAPGTAPVLGEELGTLSFGEVLPAADFESGDFVVTITAAGALMPVYYESDVVSPGALASVLISIFDADANEVAPWSLRLFNAAGAVAALSETNFPPTARFYHASTALTTADVYNDETLMAPPFLTNHAFGDVTGDIVLPAGSNLLFYTAAGMPGTPLFDSQVITFVGTHKHLYVVGDVDALQAIETAPDRRGVETVVKFSFLHTALNHESVDVYIVDAGTDIADAIPRIFGLTIGIGPITITLQEGSYEIYLTPAAETTVITGPIALDASFGDVYEFIAYDNLGDPMTADIVSIPIL